MLLTTQQIVDDPSNLALLLSKGHPAMDASVAASFLKSPYVAAFVILAVRNELDAAVGRAIEQFKAEQKAGSPSD